MKKIKDLPYSKYLNYTKEDFKANNFEYKKKANVWYLDKVDGRDAKGKKKQSVDELM